MMTIADDLSENQQRMLLRFFTGDIPEAFVDGYYWESDPTEKVDGRTLVSLVNHGLISARGRLGAGGLWSRYFSITERGGGVANELDEAARERKRVWRE